ncbi:hypothetical protein ACFSKU_00220 [Pontibacter silvestris]|uniref:Uncharacterized protein n=1 Tax=Pontibacter silvestris TaxID=2305183 RepID=A0ABW4WTW9_9BACT|nr:hypothetical protein [Pontibacter silvestris]MCC9138562.1 hypothetical protein [Pontibacter silvestris]
MPNQKDSNIEDFAFDYLKSHYSTLYSTKGILISKAEKTKLHGTADGIFALKKPDNTLFIASLNVSQSQQLARLLNRYKKNGLSKFRFVTALIAFAATTFFTRSLGYGILSWVIPVAATLVIFVTHSLLERSYLKHKVEKLLNIFKAQPADEQWLGISISSLAFRHNSLAKHLLNLCERRGIGLITVGKRAKVVQLKDPRTNTCHKGDFVSHYVTEAHIRKTLLGGSFLRVA